MELKKLMVPTDFSSCALAASRVAMGIAQKAGAELYFIHLFENATESSHVPTHTVKHDSDEHKEKVGAIKNKLQFLITEAADRNLKAFPMLVMNPGDKIENYLAPVHIDLVVMGSHGVKGIKGKFIGSKAQHFIRHSSVPVLVIKQEVKPNFKKIIFAYNFENDLIKPFETVLKFVRLWQSELHLLYVNVSHHFAGNEKIQFNIKRFMHQFPRVDYTTHIYNTKDEETGIDLFSRELNADLIAVVTHGKTGVSRMLSHSVAESVINRTGIPVLVMNIANH